MQTASFKNFIRLFPHLPQQNVQSLYMQPFHPSCIVESFEGWEYNEYYHCYIDNSEERNLVRFEDFTYSINGQRFKSPHTLNEFIEDCQATGVRLLWSESMANRLWFNPMVEGSNKGYMKFNKSL